MMDQFLKKINKVIRFNQNAWLKLYIGMKLIYEKKQKMILKKIFSS